MGESTATRIGGRSTPSPRYTLRSAVAPTDLFEPSGEQQAVISHRSGRLKVLAGPGTGKTATIVAAVAERIEHRHADPSSILVLTFSRRAAAELTDRVARRLALTTSEPMVRTMHSYAYSLLRAQAAEAGIPPPTLLPAGQADLVVREMLAGHADDGGAYWPADLASALRVPSFAGELRELLLRIGERRISARQVAAAGKRFGRPEWEAVAAFMREYRDVVSLRRGSGRLGAKLDQAELLVAALDALRGSEILAAQRRRVRRIFIDEYQDVDPAQVALIEMLGAGCEELVVFGDPDQSIYTFRGAAAGALDRFEADATVNLTISRRLPANLITATRRIAARLPGRGDHRALRADVGGGAGTEAGCGDAPGGESESLTPGRVEIRVVSNGADEAATVADILRRAHLEEGISWSEMAVLLRSPSVSGQPILRAMAAVGVPVHQPTLGPLATQPIVAALLAVLRAATTERALADERAWWLLQSPLGGMDVVSVRRLRRALRAIAESAGTERGTTTGSMVSGVLLGLSEAPTALPADLREPLVHLAGLIAIASAHADDPAAHSVLWKVWQASGLEHRWRTASERGGAEGRRAAAGLDLVMSLFERAAHLSSELPYAGVAGLLSLLDDEQLSDGPVDRMPVDAVAVLSAHASKGLEWDLVIVAGVQEDSWPDLRPRRSLLRCEELIDAVSGNGICLPLAGIVPDERRLFYVAVTRARRTLVVTTVQSPTDTPSRFVEELADIDLDDDAAGADPGSRERRAAASDVMVMGDRAESGGQGPVRGLNLPALVAELRQVVCAPAAATVVDRPDRKWEQRRVEAASVLAVLGESGVRGADPDDWVGLAELSTEAPAIAAGSAVTLSPSQVEAATQCPLRTVLDRNGGRTNPGMAQLLGIAVHAMAQGIAHGATAAELDGAREEFLAAQQGMAKWEVERLRRRMDRMRVALAEWVATRSDGQTLLGSELPLDLVVPNVAIDELHDTIRIRGQIDWLSLDSDGRVYVTDFKTGTSVPSREAAREHAQLATYQLALALGALTGQLGEATENPAGAELVYVASGAPVVRVQPALGPEDRAAWLSELRAIAATIVGPRVVARTGPHCDTCPVRSSCPVQAEGRQVTQ